MESIHNCPGSKGSNLSQYESILVRLDRLCDFETQQEILLSVTSRFWVHFLVSPLIIEPVNVLWVTLREPKRHEGAYGANDPAYDNSGLSDVVDDWGVFGLTSRFTGCYIRNIKERNPQVYMIKRETVNGWGIKRVILGEVRPIVVRD
ncbi:hypothetical protein PIB30_086260 [Stylosanthes scabra]|uniref:Uncharacterized protein n=1 Tax=Stylosanthes scabra TaxID=79078 RepID=A0ABU6TSK3_9FABA|nr:hypothetical protein [Stylosanthes scabra]